MLASVAEGLAHAHGATVETGGIVHRDISPANIMISRAGHVKLIDFGIAREGTGATNSISGVVRGKFPYMSPEQASGDPLDGRGDVFSLGVVAYELFSGQRPFDAPSDLKILDRIRFDEPTALSEVVPSMDSDLADLVMQCLSKERDDRPTSSEMAARLALWLHAQPDPVGAGELGKLVLESLASESHEKWSLDEALQGGLASDSGASTGTATWSLSAPLSSGGGEKAPVFSERTPAGLDEETGELLRSLLEVRPVRAMKHLKWAIAGLSVLVFALMAWNLWMLEDQKEYRTLVGENLSPPPSPERASLKQIAPTEIRRRASPSMVQSRRSLELQQSHRTVSVVSHPPGARIRLGSGPGPGLLAPVHRALKPGERVEGRATLRGHRTRSFVLTDESPDIVHIRLAAVGKGTVRFRFLPANASVVLDGKVLDTAGGNVVARKLAEGEHSLEIRSAGGGSGTIRKFTIRASETTTLGTIER
jgi:serine/threonine protein kinase